MKETVKAAEELSCKMYMHHLLFAWVASKTWKITTTLYPKVNMIHSPFITHTNFCFVISVTKVSIYNQETLSNVIFSLYR